MNPSVIISCVKIVHVCLQINCLMKCLSSLSPIWWEKMIVGRNFHRNPYLNFNVLEHKVSRFHQCFESSPYQNSRSSKTYNKTTIRREILRQAYMTYFQTDTSLLEGWQTLTSFQRLYFIEHVSVISTHEININLFIIHHYG